MRCGNYSARYCWAWCTMNILLQQSLCPFKGKMRNAGCSVVQIQATHDFSSLLCNLSWLPSLQPSRSYIAHAHATSGIFGIGIFACKRSSRIMEGVTCLQRNTPASNLLIASICSLLKQFDDDYSTYNTARSPAETSNHLDP